MFHTYIFQSSAFHDWMTASNQLYLHKFLEMGGKQQEYQSLQVDPQEGDLYLLYVDDEGGVCGSAVITLIPYSLEINNIPIPAGTCALRNVLFHIKVGHTLQDQPDKFERILKMFHFCLFEHLWHKSKGAAHKIALSLQTDPEAHDDLKDFGGFTFDTEVILDEEGQSLAMGVMALTAQNYSAYQIQKEENFNTQQAQGYTFGSLRYKSLSQSEMRS